VSSRSAGRRAAVLGHPVAHSLSPVLHRAAYAALGLDDWRYDAVDVTEGALPAFVAGLDEARGGAPLSNALFGVRARVVTGAMPATQARSFVSGLLIGAEFVAALAGAGVDLVCIGSATLRDRYTRAARHFGVALAGLEPEHVYCAALARFIDRISA